MLDESFQVIQTQHKAAASVFRFAKATWQESVSPVNLQTYQVMKETMETRAITVTF